MKSFRLSQNWITLRTRHRWKSIDNVVSTVNVSCSLESVKSERVAEQETQIFKRYWFFIFPLPNRDSLVSVGNLRSILTPMTRFKLIELSRHYRSIRLHKTRFSERSHKMCFVIDFSIPRRVGLKESRRENEKCGKKEGPSGREKSRYGKAGASKINFIVIDISLICCSTIRYRAIMCQPQCFLISIATAVLEPALSTITAHYKTYCFLWREM